MVNLKEKPFYLSDEEIAWVESAYSHMTLEEKTGQLFVQMRTSTEENSIKQTLADFHQGGLRYPPSDSKTVWQQNIHYQKYSKIPLLIAANCDNGGDGSCTDGTLIQTAAGAGAGGMEETAYDMGYVSGKEATAMGCNWTFNPCVDIFLNWRNTIINTRSFGDDADTVVKCAKAYIRGVHESNMACCCKHFPGDGVEERDQHLVLGVNDLSVEEWEDTFGRVYQSMIDEGAESIMVGHFAFPAMSRKLVPGIKDSEIMPATLAPEILQTLLREQLSFQGLIITDASHMAGFANMMKRSEAVPYAIASGCDMFLFSNDMEEDFEYMRAGIESGIIKEERLKDAIYRILGLKAKLKLPDLQRKGNLVPSDYSVVREMIGCKDHRKMAEKAADACITLVKDTQNNLPISPKTHKRLIVYVISSTPVSRAFQGDPMKAVIKEELEAVGFQVDIAPDFHDLEAKYGVKEEHDEMIETPGSRADFVSRYDAAMVFVNIKGYAQENNVRIRWSHSHSNEVPWYVTEVPTIGVSLNYTTHLLELPQVHTFINAYNNQRSTIKAVIAKIMGESQWKGKANESVFCGKWDTRL